MYIYIYIYICMYVYIYIYIYILYPAAQERLGEFKGRDGAGRRSPQKYNIILSTKY